MAQQRLGMGPLYFTVLDIIKQRMAQHAVVLIPGESEKFTGTY